MERGCRHHGVIRTKFFVRGLEGTHDDLNIRTRDEVSLGDRSQLGSGFRHRMAQPLRAMSRVAWPVPQPISRTRLVAERLQRDRTSVIASAGYPGRAPS